MRAEQRRVLLLAAALATVACSGTAKPVAFPTTTTASTVPTTLPPTSTTSTTQPPSWADIYRTVSSGVVRIDATTCDGGGTGSGFLVTPTLVATVAHVVDGAQSIRVTQPGLALATSAAVVGFDLSHDFALVQVSSPILGHAFPLETTQPEIGTEMAAIGFPLASSMAMAIGHVTAEHDRRQVEGLPDPLSDMLVTDAATNPGNSGGPWLTRDGKVIALAESGPKYVPEAHSLAQGDNGGVPADTAALLIDKWEQSLQTVTPPACPGQPSDPAQVASLSALATLRQYFTDIYTNDYPSAYAQLISADPSGLAAFIGAVKTSQDVAADSTADAPKWFDIDNVTYAGNAVVADIRFRSTQDAAHGPSGETCTDWRLRYTFSQHNGLWLIGDVVPQPGQPESAACPVGDPASATTAPPTTG